MQKLNYRLILNKFTEIIKKHEKDILNLWDKDRKEYTKYILRSSNSITQKVSKELGLNIHYEYYSLDAVFYTNSDLVLKTPKNKTWINDEATWLNHISIAFEHENVIGGKNGIYQEISHLLLTNSDYKVLMTYPKCSNYSMYIEDIQDVIPENCTESILVIFLRYTETNSLEIKTWNIHKNSIDEILA